MLTILMVEKTWITRKIIATVQWKNIAGLSAHDSSHGAAYYMPTLASRFSTSCNQLFESQQLA
jgi:hypothetical protein